MKNSTVSGIILCLISLSIGLSAQNTKADHRQDIRMMPRSGSGMMPMGGMMPFGGGGANRFGVEFATEMPQDEDVIMESESDTLYNYHVENVKFSKPVKLVFSDNNAELTNIPEGVKIEADGAYLTITSGLPAPWPSNLVERQRMAH